MENRLKERLTGAVIIVALIVVLVPQMFRGQHGQGTSAASSGAEGPPLRTYTIDLSNTAARKAPLQSAPDAAASTTDAATTSAASAPPSASSAPSVTPAPPVASTAGPSGADEPVAKPKPASSTHTAAPAHAEAAVAAPTHVSHASDSSGWSVQLGLFVKRENAERLMHAAQDKGFAVSVSGADAKGQFRVHVTGMADRNAAQAVAARLKADGFAAAVVGPQ